MALRSCPPEGRGHLANVGQEAPCRFSGYSAVLWLSATPTLPASEALEPQLHTSGCRETTSPFCIDVSGAVLVPPTGNRVLNQIPAGDGRESSREQAVLGDRAPFLQSCLSQGRETISPDCRTLRLGSRAASLTHQKKKKKKKVERSRGWTRPHPAKS